MKRFKRLSPHALRRRPINILASLLTTTNLYCGILSIFASIGREFDNAAVFILVAIIFDMLDGAVARLTHSTSDFGKELDSLCDLVSFGVAPGVLVFCAYLTDADYLLDPTATGSIVGRGGSFMAVVYIICAALRLARFNTYQATVKGTFVGLPSPAAGGVIASFILFYDFFQGRPAPRQLDAWAFYTLGPMAVLLALLMMSTVRYQKNPLRTLIMGPRTGFFTLGLWAFIIAFVIHPPLTLSPTLLLFPLGLSYVLYGIGDHVYRRLLRRAPRGERTETEGVEQPKTGSNGKTPQESGLPGPAGAAKNSEPR